MPFRFVLLNRLNLCELFFDKSVREGGGGEYFGWGFFGIVGIKL